MKAGQKLWTREELVLTMNLYCKLPFGKLHASNPDIIALARLLGRTANAVAYKLVNLASLDPSLQARGIRGAANVSKLDRAIWDEFFGNWDTLPYESEVLRAKLEGRPIGQFTENDDGVRESLFGKEGLTREQVVKARVNQRFFRQMILASYNNACCITGLNLSGLLVASHIIPWAKDEKNRMNPRNGLALNPLHDKAFEQGLIAITPDYNIVVSPTLKREKPVDELLWRYAGQTIRLPSRFLPDPDFLALHYEERFLK